MSDQRLPTPALAARYGVSTFTVLRWAKRGMPHYRSGRVYRFDPVECDAWLHNADADETDDYRANIKRLVDQAPPLTAAQADKIRAILSGGVT